MALRFILNGVARDEAAVAPTTTVLDWLRIRAGLTGTKEGCAEGDCGACTILIGRARGDTMRYEAVNSCLLLMGQLDGAGVLTIEGLTPAKGLHPVQEALVAADATQCGFCTPGFAMAIAAFQQDAARDDASIHEALAGNLCRCTGYRAIVDACRALPRGAIETTTAPPPRTSAHEAEGQTYLAPTTLAELLDLRGRHKDAVLLAGGTDLGLRVSKGRERWPLTVSTAAVAELKTITETSSEIVIGAAATYTDVLPALDRNIPSFAALVRRIGSVQIRNLGTLAGNLATASPIGDTLPCLVALGAQVDLASRTGARSLAVEGFITGYRTTALRADEIITRIIVPVPAAAERFAAYKVSKRFDQDISTVVAAFCLRRGEIRAAFGGMASRVARAPAVEQALMAGGAAGLPVDALQALVVRDFSPMSDHRGNAAYRLRAAAGLVRRFALETAAQAVASLHGGEVAAAAPARRPGGDPGHVAHDSARGHVSGRALFADDVPLPTGSLEAALVMSPHAHARIVSVDVSRARAAPGVVAAITAADIPGKNDVGPIFSGEPVLAAGEVTYEGQPVAAIAATTLDQARAAARLVDVTYEPLPAVLTVEEALARELYVSPPQTIARGDLAGGFAQATQRLTGEVRSGAQDHFYLEGQIAVATPGETGDMHVLSSTQHPTEVQHGVAHLLGLPFAAVTAEVRRIGGGFGGKESQATIIAGIAAVLASKVRRPVKLRLPRDDDMRATGKRHPFLICYDAGIDDEGRILALDMILAANGGNVADHTPAVVTRALCHVDNCYWLPNVRLRGLACMTHTVSNTAFRGYGGPQGMLAIETVIDAIARRLGLPTDEVRRRNWYGVGERNVTPYGMTVEDNIIARVRDELDRATDLASWRAEVDAFNRGSPVIRRGLATMPVKFGISFNRTALNQAGALLHVYTDGSVLLNHGGIEMGQGLFVKVAQVVAKTFEIGLDAVRLSPTTTGKVPNTPPTAASSGSDLYGAAARDAALQIKARMTAVAAEQFGVGEDAIEFNAGRVYAGNRSLSFQELAGLAWEKRVSLSAAGYYRTPKIHWDPKTGTGRPFFYFTYGMAAAEVAVDTLTGESRVLRAELIQDCGRSLNPAIDLGQIEGAFVQGMGWLTSEEVCWDAEGRLRTHGPSTYKIPGSRDVPPVFRARLLESAPNREDTIFHSKAVGEPPLMLAISVWLAIRDAVASLGPPAAVARLDAPATPERVLAAVERMRTTTGRGAMKNA